MRPVRPLLGWWEAAALVLVGSWMLWSLASTVRSDWGWGGAVPYLLCPVGLAAGVAAGSALPRLARSPGLPLALVVSAAALVLGVLLVREPGKGPVGYPNANAALAVQLVALTGLALLSTSSGRRRPLVLSLALCVTAVALNRSAAGVAVVVPVAAVVSLVAWRRPTRVGWPVGAVVVGALSAVGAAWLIVGAARQPAFPGWAERAFDPVREQLWRDAVELWDEAPVTGSGPGSFSAATALSVDPDTMAAHSSVLQVGSETGWVGVAFLGLVGLTGLLWTLRGRPAEALVGATAWAALFVHSTADHLLEFGSVVTLAGAVVGWAGASGRVCDPGSEELDVTQREGPLAG